MIIGKATKIEKLKKLKWCKQKIEKSEKPENIKNLESEKLEKCKFWKSKTLNFWVFEGWRAQIWKIQTNWKNAKTEKLKNWRLEI